MEGEPRQHLLPYQIIMPMEFTVNDMLTLRAMMRLLDITELKGISKYGTELSHEIPIFKTCPGSSPVEDKSVLADLARGFFDNIIRPYLGERNQRVDLGFSFRIVTHTQLVDVVCEVKLANRPRGKFIVPPTVFELPIPDRFQIAKMHLTPVNKQP